MNLLPVKLGENRALVFACHPATCFRGDWLSAELNFVEAAYDEDVAPPLQQLGVLACPTCGGETFKLVVVYDPPKVL